MSQMKTVLRTRIVALSVPLLVAAGAACLVLRGQPSARADSLPSEPARASVPADPPLKVVAYYFHVTVRCVTCRKIESYSREAIEKGFAKELKEGAVEWRPVNVQLPENRHFIRDYRLFTRSLVLVKIRGGRQVEWRNLEKVWELVGRKGEFVNYVQSNVRAYLGDG